MARWCGARSATNARTDEDAAMAHQALPGRYATREDARAALLEMIRAEMLAVYDHPYCFGRLSVILGALLTNPEVNGFEHDGLRFGIWEVP